MTLKKIADGVYENKQGIRVRRCLAEAHRDRKYSKPYSHIRANDHRLGSQSQHYPQRSCWRVSYKGRVLDSRLTLKAARRDLPIYLKMING